MRRNVTLIVLLACVSRCQGKAPKVGQKDGQFLAEQDKLMDKALTALPGGATPRRLAFLEQFNQFLEELKPTTTTTTTTRTRKVFKPPQVDRRVVGGAVVAGAATLIVPSILSSTNKIATTTTKPKANLGGVAIAAALAGVGGYAALDFSKVGRNVSEIPKPKIGAEESFAKQEATKVSNDDEVSKQETPEALSPKEWIRRWEARLPPDEGGSETPPGAVGAIPNRASWTSLSGSGSLGRFPKMPLRGAFRHRFVKLASVDHRPSPSLWLLLLGFLVGTSLVFKPRWVVAGEERLLAA